MIKARQSNFELLRIISMILIVAHHYSYHGDWGFSVGFEMHKFYVQSLSIGGKLGVNLFVLISSYFLCKKEFKWEGVLKVISVTWFYSIAILLVFIFFNIDNLPKDKILLSIFPFGYWFVSSYVFLVLLSPFINKIIDNINLKEHLFLIIALSIVSMVPYLNKTIGDLGFFIYLYFVGALFREYSNDWSLNLYYLVIGIISNIILILLSIVCLDFMSEINVLFNKPLYFAEMKSPLMISLSILIFLFFKNVNIGEIRIVNTLSSLMFGVYLIHENTIIKTHIWTDILNNKEYLYNNLVSHSIFSILSVFMICVFIEFLRVKLVCYLNLNRIFKR